MDPLESFRRINRELLVLAGGDLPPAVADAIDLSRDNLTRAIRLLSPEFGKTRPAEEMPVQDFKRQSERSASHFRDCLGESEQDATR